MTMTNPFNGSGRAAGVVVEKDKGCDCGGGHSTKAQCYTTWYKAKNSNRAEDPLNQPCANELSAFVRDGSTKMRSFFASCPFEIINADVPGDDLGNVSAFRAAVDGARALGIGDPTTYVNALSSPLVVTGVGAGGRVQLGVYARIAFDIPTTQALILTVATAGAITVVGSVAVNRSITVQFQAGCNTIELFVPFALPESSSTQIWAPRVSAIAPASLSATFTGLPTGGGSIATQFLSANSPVLGDIAGAILNA